MTTRQLLRFAVNRPPVASGEHPHVIQGPFSAAPGTEFQQSVARAESVAAAVRLAEDFVESAGYAGALLRARPGTRNVIRALPGLLLIKDEERLAAALQELAGQWPKNGAGEAILWDSLIALALVRKPPHQDVADLSDALRVREATARRSAGSLAALTAVPLLPVWLLPQPVAGSPADRGIRPVGVTDLLLIEEELEGYRQAELSYIENVLRTEKKERTFRRLDRTTDSYRLTTENAEESERDLQSTSRSEMQSEVSQTATQDASLTTGVSISASYGPFVTVDTSVEGSLGTSTETASSVSDSYAQDIVDRSAAKVSRRTVETVVQRVLAETEETTFHGFDNVGGAENVVGHYRWLEQVLRAQVMNYGRRMLMEFMIFEPAAVYRAARDSRTTAKITLTEPPPLGSLQPADLTEDTYQAFVSLYRATGVTPPPALTLSVSKAFEMPELKHQKDLNGKDFVVATKSGGIDVPAGYVATHAWVSESKTSFGTGDESLRVHVADRIINLTTGPRDGSLSNVTGPVEVVIYLYDFKAAAIAIRVACERTAEAMAQWQLDTYTRIANAYQAQLDAYRAELKSSGYTEQNAQADLSPEIKRQIERDELKRSALTMLTGQDLSAFDALSDPADPGGVPVLDVAEALKEGDLVRFCEQAFEWVNEAYLYYPYFWGRQDNWFTVLAETDSDPIFQSFLQAGSARLQVPVRPGFELAVLYYLYTGDLWRGGAVPAIGDPFYLPIIDELAEATGLSLTDTTPYGEPWIYALPTTLVSLDDDVSDLGL